MPLTFLGNHDVTRIASQVPDERHHPHAVALLGFLPGVPSVYYGDELGLRAVKEERWAATTPSVPRMPDRPDDVPDARPEVTELYRRVLGLRRRHPWLVDAVDRSHPGRERSGRRAGPCPAGQDTLHLGLNLTDDPMPLPPGSRVLESSPEGEPATDRLVVAPHGWAVTG